MKTAMKQLSLFALLVALFTACGGGEKAASPSAELAGRIKAMEDSLFNATSYDQRKAQSLLDVYKAFAATHNAFAATHKAFAEHTSPLQQDTMP
jgi:hypothetical protein